MRPVKVKHKLFIIDEVSDLLCHIMFRHTFLLMMNQNTIFSLFGTTKCTVPRQLQLATKGFQIFIAKQRMHRARLCASQVMWPVWTYTSQLNLPKVMSARWVLSLVKTWQIFCQVHQKTGPGGGTVYDGSETFCRGWFYCFLYDHF